MMTTASPNVPSLLPRRRAAIDLPRSPKKSGAGWIVATVLFVAIVAGAAWITQYVPRGVKTGSSSPNTGPIRQADLDFVVMNALWEKPNPAQVEERPHAGIRARCPGVLRLSLPQQTRIPDDDRLLSDELRLHRPQGDLVVAGGGRETADGCRPGCRSRISLGEPDRDAEGQEVRHRNLPGGGASSGCSGTAEKGPASSSISTSPSGWASDRLDEKVFATARADRHHEPRFASARLGCRSARCRPAASPRGPSIHSATRTTLPLVVDKAQLDELFDVKLEPLDAAALKKLETQLLAEKIEHDLQGRHPSCGHEKEQQGKQPGPGTLQPSTVIHLEGDDEASGPLVTATWPRRRRDRHRRGARPGRFSALSGRKEGESQAGPAVDREPGRSGRHRRPSSGPVDAREKGLGHGVVRRTLEHCHAWEPGRDIARRRRHHSPHGNAAPRRIRISVVATGGQG